MRALSIIRKYQAQAQGEKDQERKTFLKRTNGTKLLAIYGNDKIRRNSDSSRRHSAHGFVFLGKEVECELFLAVSSKGVKSAYQS